MDKAANDTPERWVDISGYEGLYQVSDKGRVKHLPRSQIRNGITFYYNELILCHWIGTTSLYDCVGLYKNRNRVKFSVHRLVARHFLPTWNETLEVNHRDGNRYNNAASNLEMCTRKENVRHSISHFLKNDYGEKSKNAKLKNIQAQEIRQKYQAGILTQDTLARQYGVSPQTISAIVRYKKYIR